MRFRDAIGCLFALLTGGLSLLAGGLTLIAIRRWPWSYHDDGRYYDAVADVVYHDGAAVVYAMLALVAWAGVGLLLLSSYRLTKRSKKPEPLRGAFEGARSWATLRRDEGPRSR